MSKEKFFIFTRGRTGSTAIIDELDNHPDIVALQELFISLEKSPELSKAYLEHGKGFYKHISAPYQVLPYGAWSSQYRRFRLPVIGVTYLACNRLISEKGMLSLYLDQSEQRTLLSGQGKRFGFKVLANHFDERPDLAGALKARGYMAIYLERKNTVKLILSGLIARQRGIYNLKNYIASEESYVIDLEDFEKRVIWAKDSVQKEKTWLKEKGFDVHVITYEDFVEDRETFFQGICSMLDIPFMLPPETDYSVMIPDLSKTIANYESLVTKVHEMGISDPL
ncbi:hypothetical protein Ga0123461_1883 [Mariprofundus aestuarium]|uniref:Sulfotransferase family protein n=1 Tax=Mariprofundus aestuarium TaxID=1921086 RepID=A0A2K8KZ71_MARES|nr:hypothetical protein [Mariprofundus aestuarium]ATX80295.1 hypothetical protein Ga0123461_1883 [Mariprofundus aestuarium]